MKIEQKIKKAFRRSWDEKTCYPFLRNEWNENLPEVGQCAVTALVIQEFYGGEIAFNKRRNHFFNHLPSGQIIDLTRKQFKNVNNLKADCFVNRTEILESEAAKSVQTKNRYKVLKRRVNKELKSI
jgi:hypothetical protein